MLFGLETVTLTDRQETEMKRAELQIFTDIFSSGETWMDGTRNEHIWENTESRCEKRKSRGQGKMEEDDILWQLLEILI